MSFVVSFFIFIVWYVVLLTTQAHTKEKKNDRNIGVHIKNDGNPLLSGHVDIKGRL